MAAPKRELFKAADVCEVVQVQPYVLRSWEAEFPQIGEAPAGGGPRLYRRADVELVIRIKQLVFDEGLTLSGARRRLSEEGAGEAQDNGAEILAHEVLGTPMSPSRNDPVRDSMRDRLVQVKAGLREILQILQADAGGAAELELVPPPAVMKKTVAKAAKRK